MSSSTSSRHLAPSGGGGRTFYPSSTSSTYHRRSSSRDRGTGTERSGSGRSYPSAPEERSSRSRDLYSQTAGNRMTDMEFSSYYRDRFGSLSPEEYKNLRLSHIDPKIPNLELREALEKEFGRYGEMQVKIVPQGSQIADRLAYINFDRPDLARRARKACLPKLAEILGRYLKVDPAGVIRDQDGRYVLDRANQLPPVGPGGYPVRRTPSPPPPRDSAYVDRRPHSRSNGDHFSGGRERRDDFYGGRSNAYPPPTRGPAPSRSRSSVSPPPRREAEKNGGSHARLHSRGSISKERGRERDREPHPPPANAISSSRSRRSQSRSHRENNQSELELWKLREDLEQGATRTLFVGNLPGDIREEELKRVFERFGKVEDIDIKHPHETTGAAYAFIMFQNMDQAQGAKYSLTDQPIAGKTCKIGYGKPMKSSRLWIGGLGPWTSLESLEKEFDRYGAIEKIEYSRGGNHAYVLFASEPAASEACRAMKGFPLGGHDRCIRVDFASMSNKSASSSEDESPPQNLKIASRSKEFPREPGEVILPRKRSMSREGGPPRKSGRRGPHTPTSSPPPSPKRGAREVSKKRDSGELAPPPTAEKHMPPALNAAGQQHLSATNLTEIEQIRSACWTGALVLKKSAYPIRLYNLRGDDDLIDGLLRDSSHESIKLHVTQRLPYAQASQVEFHRYLEIAPAQAAFLLAGPNPNATAGDLRLANSPTRPLKAFVHYLAEKSAAGVVSLAPGAEGGGAVAGGLLGATGGSVLYVFPRCELADNLLKELSPNLAVMRNCTDDCLLAVLVKAGGSGAKIAPGAEKSG